MGDFYDKTDYLIETKGLLKDRINSLGGSITSGTTFRDYLVWLDSLYEALEEKTIIGLPDSLEGKCEQDGTPTPDSPVPINITTGRQVVSVINKNLAEWETTQDTSRYTYSSFTAQDISVSKTATGGSFYASFILHIPKAGTYYLKGNNSSNQQFYIYTDRLWGTLKESFSVSTTGDFTRGTTFNSAGDYVVGLYGSPLGNYSVKNFMCTTISDTTYEAYTGNTYEINLGKNYFDTHSGTTITSVNVQFTRNDDGTITLNGTSNAYGYVEILCAFQNGTAQQSNINLPLNSSYTYSISLTQLSGTTTNNDIRFICQYDGSGNQKTTYMGTSQTISNCEGLYRAYIRIPPNVVFTNLKLGIQLEKGSQASSFSPYKTPIYLGKIGTYQDYIFKNTTENPLYDSNLEEGQWYLHKEVGKVVFNGSENWQIRNSGTAKWMYYCVVSLPIITDSTVKNSRCNYYPVGAVGNTNTNTGYYIVRNGEFRIRWGTQDTVANFKTWLSSHNVEVYYVLNTPTNTLIEDEELINQLNEIEIFTVISEDFYN